jgi:hypothetical protein
MTAQEKATTVRHSLAEALSICVSNNPSERSPKALQAFLDTAAMMSQTLSRKEFATVVIVTSPGPKICEIASGRVKVAVMKYLAKTQQHKADLQDMWNAIRGEMDLALSNFWADQKKSGVSQSAFVLSHIDVLAMFATSSS